MIAVVRLSSVVLREIKSAVTTILVVLAVTAFVECSEFRWTHPRWGWFHSGHEWLICHEFVELLNKIEVALGFFKEVCCNFMSCKPVATAFALLASPGRHRCLPGFNNPESRLIALRTVRKDCLLERHCFLECLVNQVDQLFALGQSS